MEITVKPLKQVDIVKVSGRIDSATAPEFDTALKGLLDRGRRRIVIDCEHLEYISSAGLRAMLAALKAAKAGGGNVVLAKVNERVRDTLSLVGFQTLFLQYTDIVDAIDSF
ncbi:MAG: STAS domain-containing protein [Anaerolineae bacterium]|nr:STAS domain-containing protein [Thermoflexales bacterium]MDW8408961.1 STAS domain-containing protein [Anaerolineae bacterium]